MVNQTLLLTLLRATFATPRDARHWWRSPHPMLNGMSPSAAVKTPDGWERVRDIVVAVHCGGVV
jgi:uncharacterized protein (DUF2384 family)